MTGSRAREGGSGTGIRRILWGPSMVGRQHGGAQAGTVTIIVSALQCSLHGGVLRGCRFCLASTPKRGGRMLPRTTSGARFCSMRRGVAQERCQGDTMRKDAKIFSEGTGSGEHPILPTALHADPGSFFLTVLVSSTLMSLSASSPFSRTRKSSRSPHGSSTDSATL